MPAPCLPPADWLAHEAHVWWVCPESVSDPAVLARYAAALSPDETARYQRFRFAKDRHQFLVSHALVRQVLSLYADIPPAAWQFVANPQGRPEIAASLIGLPLRFNLTHTAGLAACVVSLETDCGIDAEMLSLPANPSGIALKMFAANEQRDLASLQGAAYLSRFFSYWTLREAYCKAIGLGLSAEMDTFAFEVAEPAPIRIRFSAGYEDAGHWQFTLLHLTPQHMVAVALRPNLPSGEKPVRLLAFGTDTCEAGNVAQAQGLGDTCR